MNILQHGENDGKSHHVSVRLVCKDKLTIRIQDDCRKFDPRERMDMYDSKTPEKNIGLRLVSKAASSVDYYNNAGINTLILKISAA
jgi:anti-sigma regulatory factor (Ser/Thr protein kinase)